MSDNATVIIGLFRKTSRVYVMIIKRYNTDRVTSRHKKRVLVDLWVVYIVLPLVSKHIYPTEQAILLNTRHE